MGEECIGIARAVIGPDVVRGLRFEALQTMQRRVRLLHLWKRGLRQILSPLGHPPTLAENAVG